MNQLPLTLLTWVPLALFASVARLPQLGVTPEFTESVRQYAGPSALDPKRVLALGLAYFLIQALVKFIQAWFAAHPEKSWFAPLAAGDPKVALALDIDGSLNAARNLAKSGNAAADISEQLQKWRGLKRVEADKIAYQVLSEAGR